MIRIVLCSLVAAAVLSPAMVGMETSQGSATGATPAATPIVSCDDASDAQLWACLRRPLHFPSLARGETCPRSKLHRVVPHVFSPVVGSGPLYAASFGETGGISYRGSREEGGWYYVKVLWLADPTYRGPVLIRGKQLDGPHVLRFGEGPHPTAELQLPPGDGRAATTAPGWSNWPTYTRVRAPGCYAYQVDGLDFSEIIVVPAQG